MFRITVCQMSSNCASDGAAETANFTTDAQVFYEELQHFFCIMVCVIGIWLPRRSAIGSIIPRENINIFCKEVP